MISRPLPARGFTLIEVMVTMMLTTLLVIALSSLWGMVGEQFALLAWRQRAVFVLNGHAEKITALYRRGEMGSTQSTVGLTVGYPAEHLDPEGNHVILSDTIDGLNLVSLDAETFKTDADNEGVLLYWDQGTGADQEDDRNVVWLDKDNDVTARMSWTMDGDAGVNNCYDGAGGTPCQWVTIYLDYPYRYTGMDTPSQSMMDAPETVSLRTIVGRRY